MHSSGIPYGWMIPEELAWLEEAGKGRSNIVEIGSWLGQSTKALAKHAGTVFSVDTWEGSPEHKALLENKHSGWLYNQFCSSIADYPNIVPQRMTSLQAADLCKTRGMKFDLIFIDAAHDYESVKQDIEAWLPLLEEGGIICGHDASEAGVRQAIDEFFPNRYSLPYRMWVVNTEVNQA
jgi:predicted O-methyltransferase YrrM